MLLYLLSFYVFYSAGIGEHAVGIQCRCVRSKAKVLPPRVVIQSNKAMKIPYQKGNTDTERLPVSATHPITIPVDPSELPTTGLPKPEQTVTAEPIKSVHIQPVPPPKPK